MFRRDYEINEVLLIPNDNISNGLLVVFEEPILKSNVEKVIELCKVENYYDYTDENIYESLDKLGVNYKVIWLGNCEKIKY